MHACDYERKFQIFVADSIYFFHKGIVVQFYHFFFPSGHSSTLFCMPSDDVGSFVFFFSFCCGIAEVERFCGREIL
jgi:hypothetical protein